MRPRSPAGLPRMRQLLLPLLPQRRPARVTVLATLGGLDVALEDAAGSELLARGEACRRREGGRNRAAVGGRRADPDARRAGDRNRPASASSRRPAPSCRPLPKRRRSWRHWRRSTFAERGASPISSRASARSRWRSRGRLSVHAVEESARRARCAVAGDAPRRRPEADHHRAARPRPSSPFAAGARNLRRGRLRPATQWRQGAGDTARRFQGAADRCDLLQSRHLRARCAHPRRWRLRLDRVVPVDQFVYSAETEVVGLFSKG